MRTENQKWHERLSRLRDLYKAALTDAQVSLDIVQK